MSEHCVAGKYRRPFRRYGRADAIHDATSLLMERFNLDGAQAVAQLVKVSKQQNDSIEAAAHLCVAASLRGDGHPGAPESAGDQADQRRVGTEWVSHGVRAAVA